MTLHITPNEHGTGYIFAETGDGVEYGDAVEYFSSSKINMIANLYREMLNAKSKAITSMLSDEFFIKKGIEEWQKIEAEIRAAEISPNFISLLESNSKKEQERLLRDATLSTYQYAHLLFKSREYGFTFSSYISEKLPNDVKATEMPKFIRVTSNEVIKRGLTPYSDGRLKGIIQQRKVIVARVLDREEDWHCFFQTYKSMRGEEGWRGGQPHLHYISNKWGISRKELLQRIKDGEHPSTNVHIALLRNDKK